MGEAGRSPEFRATVAFGYVLASVCRNLGAAIRMSWPWMAVYAALQALAVTFFPGVAQILSGNTTDPLVNAPATLLVMVLLLSVSTLAFSSLAVNWHRFMLVGDEAEGLERLRIDGTVWRYLGNLSLLLLVLVPAVLIVMFIGLAASGAMLGFGEEGGASSFVLAVVIALLPILVILVTLQRLMIKLPAIALGRRDFGFGEAWADSKGNVFRLAGFVLMVMGSSYGIGFLASATLTLLAGGLGNGGLLGQLLGTSWQLAVNWIGWIIGINAITVLYAVFAEGRSV